MKFKAILRKKEEPPRNPFRPISIMGPGPPCPVVNGIEAKNKKQAIKFWEEAKHLPRFRNYELVSMEEA